MNRRIILTGAPGTGKTTLIRYLETKGIPVVHEPARQILAEQPGLASAAFTERLLQRALERWKKAVEIWGPVVFDRGIPDNIVYAQHFGLDEGPYWRAAEHHPSLAPVFICPPWEAIYTKDAERRMEYADVVVFHQQLVSVYEKLGYELIELPQLKVSDRAQILMERA